MLKVYLLTTHTCVGTTYIVLTEFQNNVHGKTSIAVDQTILEEFRIRFTVMPFLKLSGKFSRADYCIKQT